MRTLLAVALCLGLLALGAAFATGRLVISGDDNCPTIMYDHGRKCL